MVAFLERRGLDGATVLEVGGGVGEIHIELLKRGAARAVSLELSDAYDGEAVRLLREAGLEDRVERLRHDIAAAPEAVEPADVVVLHRVVCCYPDYERLLTAVAGHARSAVVLSYPPRNAASRLIVSAQNLLLRLLRKDFRTFAHPRRGCSRCSASTAFAPPSPTAVSCGGWRRSSGSRPSGRRQDRPSGGREIVRPIDVGPRSETYGESATRPEGAPPDDLPLLPPARPGVGRVGPSRGVRPTRAGLLAPRSHGALRRLAARRSASRAPASSRAQTAGRAMSETATSGARHRDNHPRGGHGLGPSGHVPDPPTAPLRTGACGERTTVSGGSALSRTAAGGCRA